MSARSLTPPGRFGGAAFLMQAGVLAFFVAAALGLLLLGAWLLALLALVFVLPVFVPPVIAARRPVRLGEGVVQVPVGWRSSAMVPLADVDSVAAMRVDDGVHFGYGVALCKGDEYLLVPPFAGRNQAAASGAARQLAAHLGVPYSASPRVRKLDVSHDPDGQEPAAIDPSDTGHGQQLSLHMGRVQRGGTLVLAIPLIAGGLALSVYTTAEGWLPWSLLWLALCLPGAFLVAMAVRPVVVSADGVSIPRARGWGRTFVPRREIHSIVVAVNDNSEVTAYCPSIRTATAVRPLPLASVSPNAAHEAASRVSRLLQVPLE